MFLLHVKIMNISNVDLLLEFLKKCRRRQITLGIGLLS